MSESARTLAYAGVAVTSIVLAGAYGWISQPDRVEGFDQVGEEFYPKFRDPGEADSLRVVAFDGETATARKFAIAQKTPGQWVIPTHYDYPADARDRLNRTANSIIGITRGPQKGQRDSEHKDLGVLDPLSDGTDFEGRGKRITLKKGDEVLADYIIGKKAGEEGNLYHVRIPKHGEVFLAEINVDLSTKFGDWIEADLLKIDKNDLREVTVNKYSIDEQRGAIKDQEVNILSREKSFDPWKLEGINEETEELKTTDVSDMVDALDNLKIVGVRPKPKGLNADLTVDPKIARSQMQLSQIVGELQGKGYFILGGEDGKPQLYANEGNVMAATEDGVVYTLNFGELFGGSEEEIEIGGKKDEEKSEPSMDDGNSRYLFVSVAFDEKYLGEKPTEPAKPVKPEGLIDQPVEKQDAKPGDASNEDATDADAQKADDGGCGPFQEEKAGEQAGKESDEKAEEQDAKKEEPKQEATDDAKADDKKPASQEEPLKQPAQDPSDATPKKEEPKPETEEEKQKRLLNQWDAAQRAYESDLKTYEADLKTYEDKVKDGKKKVADLNYRLGNWYYVISGESFKTLRLARTDLVKPKEKTPDPKDAADNQPVEPAQTPGKASEPEQKADDKQPGDADAGKDAKSDPPKNADGEPKDAAEPKDNPADKQPGEPAPDKKEQPAEDKKDSTSSKGDGNDKSSPK